MHYQNKTHLMGVSPLRVIMIAAFGFFFFNFFGMMIVMLMSMIMSALFMSMTMGVRVIFPRFYVSSCSRRGSGSSIVIMMFVSVIVSALFMSVVMRVRVIFPITIMLELQYFRFEIFNGRFQFGNVSLDGDCLIVMFVVRVVVVDGNVVLEITHRIDYNNTAQFIPSTKHCAVLFNNHDTSSIP